MHCLHSATAVFRSMAALPGRTSAPTPSRNRRIPPTLWPRSASWARCTRSPASEHAFKFQANAGLQVIPATSELFLALTIRKGPARGQKAMASSMDLASASSWCRIKQSTEQRDWPDQSLRPQYDFGGLRTTYPRDERRRFPIERSLRHSSSSQRR